MAQMTRDSDTRLTPRTPLLLTLLITSMSHSEKLGPPQWKEILGEVSIT